MLYLLFTYLHDHKIDVPGSAMFRAITFRAGAAAVTALIIAFWLGPKIIRRLRELQIGEAAKLEAPKSHLSKAGTPTMGGLIVLSSLVIPALLWADIKNGYILLILFVTVVLGAVGFLDDYLKVVKKKPTGLIGRYKIVGQVFVGLVVAGVGGLDGDVLVGYAEYAEAVVGEGFGRAGFQAKAAAAAGFGRPQKVRPAVVGFGIRTPDAAERTAFEKDRRPDARTVVDGEFFDVPDPARNLRRGPDRCSPFARS
jgi:hypothetical protein